VGAVDAQSMTGFGRGGSANGGRVVTVEARGWNHRHLDVMIRLPREYAAWEVRLRALVRARLHRGRVEMVVTAGSAGGAMAVIDTELAVRYYQALRLVAGRLDLPPGLTMADLAALPGVCAVGEPEAEPEGVWPALAAAADQALDGLQQCRAREGRALAAELEGLLATVGAHVAAVEGHLPAVREALIAAVRARYLDCAGDAGPGWRPELAVAALDRADIREELVRLRSHLRQAGECLGAQRPSGRELDVLAQELQREWTTISAKAADPVIAEHAVAARVAVEQVREQAQNVE